MDICKFYQRFLKAQSFASLPGLDCIIEYIWKSANAFKKNQNIFVADLPGKILQKTSMVVSVMSSPQADHEYSKYELAFLEFEI